MGVTKEQVESSLTSKLNPAHLEVIDTSGGCGASFAIEVVSEKFEGKRLLERHLGGKRCSGRGDETDSCTLNKESSDTRAVETTAGV
ncbi:protein BOLA2 [Prunus yedoensis var. nudiflora]|uniref:Protein BOLA2 n=1 Tax=Prunus yedoensis var. nudiflora TaxID=2094558 RepID=A0A314XRN1_PRUYE|nr:protein BOLA2 [Prunus yedoensis var. nudiflora]